MLWYRHTYVVQSFDFGGDNDNKKTRKGFYKRTPFLFDDDSKDAESLFEVYFIDPEKQGAKTYNYGFTIANDGINEEWLNYKTKNIAATGKTFSFATKITRSEYSDIFVADKSNVDCNLILRILSLFVMIQH